MTFIVDGRPMKISFYLLKVGWGLMDIGNKVTLDICSVERCRIQLSICCVHGGGSGGGGFCQSFGGALII